MSYDDVHQGITKYIYAYRNKVAGIFYQPFILDDNVKLTYDKLVRTVQLDNSASKNLRHLELWILGTYLDNEGVINPDKQFICDIDDILARVGQSLEKEEAK